MAVVKLTIQLPNRLVNWNRIHHNAAHPFQLNFTYFIKSISRNRNKNNKTNFAYGIRTLTTAHTTICRQTGECHHLRQWCCQTWCIFLLLRTWGVLMMRTIHHFYESANSLQFQNNTTNVCVLCVRSSLIDFNEIKMR